MRTKKKRRRKSSGVVHHAARSERLCNISTNSDSKSLLCHETAQLLTSTSNSLEPPINKYKRFEIPSLPTWFKLQQ